MSQLQTIPTTIQANAESHEGLENEKKSLSSLLGKIIAANRELADGDLAPLIDPLFRASLRAVLDSALFRTKTPQAEELLRLNKTVTDLFRNLQVDKNNDNLMIWLVGHLSAQLDILTLLEDTLELDADEQLVKVVSDYKHVYNILCILYDQPQLTQGELAKQLGLKPPALTMALKRVKKYQLVFDDEHGRNKYYTLSANGQKILKHLKYQTPSLTSGELTTLIKELIYSFQLVSKGDVSPKEALKQFQSHISGFTIESEELEHLMKEALKTIQRKQMFISPYDIYTNKSAAKSFVKTDKAKGVKGISNVSQVDGVKQYGSARNVGGVSNNFMLETSMPQAKKSCLVIFTGDGKMRQMGQIEINAHSLNEDVSSVVNTNSEKAEYRAKRSILR